eukprot:Opistho-2@29584
MGQSSSRTQTVTPFGAAAPANDGSELSVLFVVSRKKLIAVAQRLSCKGGLNIEIWRGLGDRQLILKDFEGDSGFKYDCVVSEVESSKYLLDLLSSHIPVIVLDGANRSQEKASAFVLESVMSGAVDYVGGPIVPELLQVRVASAIEMRRLKEKEAAIVSRVESAQPGTEELGAADGPPLKVLLDVTGIQDTTASMDSESRDVARTPLGPITKGPVPPLRKSVTADRKVSEGSTRALELMETPLQQAWRLLKLAKEGTMTPDMYQKIMNVLEDLSSDPSSIRVRNVSGIVDHETSKWLQYEFGGDVSDAGPTGAKHVDRPISVNVFDADRMDELLRRLQRWDFNVWETSMEEMMDFAVFMFVHFGVLERYHVDVIVLRNFLEQVRMSYKSSNPYHNYLHAFDVAQMVFLILVDCNANQYLNFQDIFVLLIAAFGHDGQHPGLNNSYQIAARTDLALLYNDISVLENHHASHLFCIAEKPGCNVFAKLKPDEYNNVRSKVVSCILATDMSHHFSMVDMFSARLRRLTEAAFHKDTKENRQRQQKSKDDRRMLIKVLLHAADISNVARPPELSARWSHAVQEEFFCQGDKEKELGLKVSPFMDRNNPNLPHLQANFIDYLCQPLFEALANLLPKMKIACDYISQNRAYWGERDQLNPGRP